MKNMASLRSALANSPSTDVSTVQDLALAAQSALASWFSMIPSENVQAVEQLFVKVQKADVNRDGRLSDDELAALSPDDQQVWKRRVDKFG